MSDSPIISTELVELDADFGSSTTDVITNLAQVVANAGRATDAEGLATDVLAREAKSATGVPGGVAIPHCRSASVKEPTLAFVRLKNAVDFSGPDGLADLVFMIAAPDGAGKAHLKILSKLARALVRKDFVQSLRDAESKEKIVELVTDVISGAPKKPAAEVTPADGSSEVPASASSSDDLNLIAITACPTGIAHTYMAADALAIAAAKMPGVTLHVETQGSSSITPLASDIVENADAVIFATDIGVKDRERFAGKPVIESGVKRAINEPVKMLEEAVAATKNPNAPKVAGGGGGGSSSDATEDASGLSIGKRMQQAVMTGVSYMVPFVAAGGLLLALGFLVGGYEIGEKVNDVNVWKHIATTYSLTDLPGQTIDFSGESHTFAYPGWALYLGSVLFAVGQAAMGFVVAALSGYISYAMAGRPGIAPGFVGGSISVTLGAGFIGGLVTGLLAGAVALWIGNRKVPRVLQSLMPVVIIPLGTSLVVGLLMFLLLGRPLAAILNGLQNWLTSMSGSSALILGLILGLMMCFDLGGPVNKAAYLFATAGLSNGDDASLKIMAAVMAAGMVPPIALSIATMVRKNLFTAAEQENGKSAWLLGLSFISEGAIPFAASDPLRVIPATMAGGAVTGALSMVLGVGSRAPHGGIFVFFAINPLWGWIVALLAGIAVSTVLIIALKQFWPNKTLLAQAAKDTAAVPA